MEWIIKFAFLCGYVHPDTEKRQKQLTGKSRKLNDKDMTEMQTLAADLFSMKWGKSKAETGKEHLERTDFIIEKQKEGMNRSNATRLYREYQLEQAKRKHYTMLHPVEQV